MLKRLLHSAPKRCYQVFSVKVLACKCDVIEQVDGRAFKHLGEEGWVLLDETHQEKFEVGIPHIFVDAAVYLSNI